MDNMCVVVVVLLIKRDLIFFEHKFCFYQKKNMYIRKSLTILFVTMLKYGA